MEYFLLRQDEKLMNPFSINIKETDVTLEEAFIAVGKIDDSTSIPEYFTINLLFNYYFFVSDKFKSLLDVYADDMKAIPVFLTDIETKKQFCYWKVIVEKIECLKIEDFMHYDNLTLIEERVDQRFIFRVAFEKQEYIVVSLHLAEHMLRKNLYGIKFIPVHVIQKEDEEDEGVNHF